MVEKVENEVRGKKHYDSVWLKMIPLTSSDIVTLSQDDQADNDITQDDIFN